MSIDLGQPKGIEDIATARDLEAICTAIGSLVAVGVRIVDAEGRGLASYRMLGDACVYLHSIPTMAARCDSLFQAILRPAADTPSGRILVHRCYAGLGYATSPIHHDGDLVGNLVIGPYRPQAGEEPAGPMVEGVDAARLRSLVARARTLSGDGLGRIADATRSLLDILLGMGDKVLATSTAHALSVEESYRQLLEKSRLLEENNLKLAEIDRLKSNLLATMSHELRTPLTSIIGYGDMLSSGLGGGRLTEDQMRYVRTITEKGEGLLRTISTILDVASMESGRMEVHRTRSPIVEIVEGAAARAVRESPRKDVKVEVGELCRAVVLVDPEMMGKAFYHLVDNAMKYSKPGGSVQVQVREVAQKPEGEDAVGYVVMAPKLNWIEVMVQDFGVGMPNEIQEKIFDPLFQGDASVTRHHGGLGLGLALVKHYVVANGGSVVVESRQGEGSTFFVRLPREAEGG